MYVLCSFKMPTRATVEILQMCLNITSNTFALHPIQIKYFKNQYHVRRARLLTRNHLFWITILTLSFTFTLFDLFFCVTNKNKNLFTILYHVFILLTKLATLLWVFVFNQKSHELTQLLYHFCQSPKSFVVTIDQPKLLLNSKRGIKFSYFLVICLTSLILFYVGFLPLVTLMLPCVHPILIIVSTDCTSVVARSAASIVQLFILTPTCGVGCVGISVALVIVNEIFTNLDKCW